MSAAFHNISVSVIAIAVAMSFALIACGDDSALAKAETQSSASADSSKANESECIINDIWNPGECPLSECTQKNEGQVETVWVGNIKYGGEEYFKCQNGSWVRGDERLTCDTTGAQVGDICRKSVNAGSFYYTMHGFEDYIRLYVYAGDGVWESYDPKAKITEECNKKNSGLLVWRVLDEPLGKKDTMLYECMYAFDDISSWYMSITGLNLEDITPGCVSEKPAEGDTCSFRDSGVEYDYRYKDGRWVRWDIVKENCATENVANGDTCSFEWFGEMKYYMYVNGYWEGAAYDPKLGYCVRGVERYVESDGVYFSCENGEWEQVNLVPRQFTDPRKDSLTDEEFDTLDLPQEANVGDRVGGLLEDCWRDSKFFLTQVDGEWFFNGETIKKTYDYCMPRHYYIYREGGFWTLETPEESAAYVKPPYTCPQESPGTKFVRYGEGDRPDEIYQCLCDVAVALAHPEQKESYCYRYVLVDVVFDSGRSVEKEDAVED